MKKCTILLKKGETALKTYRSAGVCALGIVVIVLGVVSCADLVDPEQKIFDGNAGIVWKGEAESHEDALTKWEEPQKDWMYFNTTEKSIYRHNGEVWMLVVDGAAFHGEGIVWKGEAESHEKALTKWGEPQKGWVYFNTTEKSLYQFGDKNWALVIEDALPADPSIIWKGKATGPDNALAKWGTPRKGWMYFNTTDHQSIYQFDGENWVLVTEGALPADPSIIWKGEAEGHNDALEKWDEPQKDWMYFNTTDQSIYQFDGENWERVAIVGDESSIPAVPVSIHISGEYLSAERGFLSVRLYFTDGSVADGYIDDTSGVVMLYTDVWNELEGYEGKTFHTLRLFNRIPLPANILISRVFNEADPVLLNIDADGELQFRAAVTNTGYPGEYIPIDTAGELALIGRDAETLTRNYLLMRNLDLLGPSTSDSLVQFPHNWQPIKGANAQGATADRFSGIFDGNGKTITNLYTNYPDSNAQAINYNSTGLFGYLDGAEIRNLTVSGSVTGYNECGGIVGSVENSVITNCSFSGAVKGYFSIGGIAGYIEGSTIITGCSNTGGTVTTTDPNFAAGGLVGCANGGIERVAITDCSNASAVSGTQNAGGIVGYIHSSTTITDSYNTGTVRTNQRYAGGIVGQILDEQGSVIIRACHNTGSISGTWNGNVGGVVGKAVQSTTIIINCSNTGTVSGDNHIGGVAGEASNIIACYNTGTVSGAGIYVGGVAGEASNITACYNTGTVSGTGTDWNTGNHVGGVAGRASNITACYNTGTVSGNTNVSVVIVGGVVGSFSGAVTACYWQANTASAGIGSGSGQTTSFPNAGDFPAVTSVHEAWGTGTGTENGWWKAGTTVGGNVRPRLWFQE